MTRPWPKWPLGIICTPKVCLVRVPSRLFFKFPMYHCRFLLANCLLAEDACHSTKDCTNFNFTTCCQPLSKRKLLTPQSPLWRAAFPVKSVESRQFTDKTVHRHWFWRQFTDKIEDSSPTLLKTVHRQNLIRICRWKNNFIRIFGYMIPSEWLKSTSKTHFFAATMF